MFVRTHHKEKFQQLCRDLAGMDSGEEQQCQQAMQGEGSAQSTERLKEKEEEEAKSPMQGWE